MYKLFEKVLMAVLLFVYFMPVFAADSAASENVAFKIDWMDTAKVTHSSLESLNSEYLAVAVSFHGLKSPAEVVFNGNNTHVTFKNGVIVKDWLFWFPESLWKAEIKSGSMHALLIKLSDSNHNKTHGRSSESMLGSYMEVRSILSFPKGMVYYNERKGSLKFELPEIKLSHQVLFLFAIPKGSSPKIEQVTIGGVNKI